LAKANLIELDLSDNALGPVGMEGLVQFLKSPVCYSLKCIRLNNNGLGIYGGRVTKIPFICNHYTATFYFRCLPKL
jgi:Ran GTPase-activating protein 1